ncbi:FixH family protein [Sphingobium boeckii]|uniref:Nitrogen fixation protein FixH n=1 Tax=Sphingobium boeckii TaxID=1082345 RepID=A0A7W9AJL6_9SPHN|nr:FixH family protein [Sphingobium boeckii]MBB5686671.1 nitrogen fixation protein FixH [Sphingobium boeckii]
MTRPFTGRHMTIILITFFGVVFAVNFTMARLAIGSFGGTVVDNSYVASQKFNGWLKDARAQKSLGWTAGVTLDPDRHVQIAIGAPAAKVAMEANATASHPLGRAADIPLSFVPIAPGRLRSVEALPAGRWTLHATIGRNGDNMRVMETVQ